MWTASIRVDRLSDILLQSLASSANLVVIWVDLIPNGPRIGSPLLPPGGREKTLFCFATTADTWRVMRVVDWTEIAADLTIVNERT